MKRWISALLGGCFMLASISVWSDSRLEVMNHLPDKLEGMVIIPEATQGHLLYLHGLAGEGRYLTRNEQGQPCMLAPVHLIAGSISQGEIGIVDNGPIILKIHNPTLARQIREGKQIESQQSADIEIVSGLDSGMHFIINPRRRWTSWLRGGEYHPKCTVITGHSMETAGLT
ncbi:hypothetical protein ABDK09_05590 [Vibrio sp. CDRSL-10 TSBA]